jgi:Na+-transporting methylmalonyl-CoA/oxaloacetate decarboxylase gamma subunit
MFALTIPSGILFITRNETGDSRMVIGIIELLLLLLGFTGVFAVGSSIALLAFGRMIDQFDTGDEAKRTRSIASPVETTKISVALFWVLFIIGGWALLQESRVVMIVGITILFAICLFMLTAVIFSFAVLNTMRGRAKGKKMPVGTPALQITPQDTPAPSSPPEGVQPVPLLRKRYNNAVTDFILDVLLKKE